MNNKLTMLGLILSAAMVLQAGSCVTSSSTRTITIQETVIIEPPSTLLKCNKVEDLPDPSTLTNLQIAKLIADLDKNLRKCKVNIDSIKAYIEQAKKDLAEAEAKAAEEAKKK